MSIPHTLRINELAQQAQADMTRFLRDMIRIPSESCQEEGVIRRIKAEMEAVGFDRVEIDPMGNVLGYIGTGPRLIAFDAHVDTVGLGNRANWLFDPYEGYEDQETIGGRGASDQEGGMASMVYAGRILKEIGLPEDVTVVMVGTVQEEDCDGLCWQYLIREVGLKPEFVCCTEPTDGGIYRGQRGLEELLVRLAASPQAAARQRIRLAGQGGAGAAGGPLRARDDVQAGLRQRQQVTKQAGCRVLGIRRLFHGGPGPARAAAGWKAAFSFKIRAFRRNPHEPSAPPSLPSPVHRRPALQRGRQRRPPGQAGARGPGRLPESLGTGAGG